MLRGLLAVFCGATVAALGALILGEYEFTGTLPYVAGLLLGLIIAEVMLAVGQRRSTPLAAAATALAFAGISWAGWIDSSEGVEPVKGAVWVAATLAAATALLRTVRRRRPTTSAPDPDVTGAG